MYVEMIQIIYDEARPSGVKNVCGKTENFTVKERGVHQLVSSSYLTSLAVSLHILMKCVQDKNVYKSPWCLQMMWF